MRSSCYENEFARHLLIRIFSNYYCYICTPKNKRIEKRFKFISAFYHAQCITIIQRLRMIIIFILNCEPHPTHTIILFCLASVPGARPPPFHARLNYAHAYAANILPRSSNYAAHNLNAYGTGEAWNRGYVLLVVKLR